MNIIQKKKLSERFWQDYGYCVDILSMQYRKDDLVAEIKLLERALEYACDYVNSIDGFCLEPDECLERVKEL